MMYENPNIINSLTNDNLTTAKDLLKHYYLSDERPLCVSFSGGKDSTSVVYVVCEMLHDLQKENIPLNKKVYIINSNTLAELPPLLEHLHASLDSIKSYAFDHDLPLIVEEVFPEDKDTLNVQLLGVGMPPPSGTFRWCTDKLKVNPIDKRIRSLFPRGEFISVIGTRKDESFSRSARIEKLSVKGTNLKINDRYPNASNLMPIEDWTTKDVWEHLFKQKNDLVNIDFLWQLYSDASGKDASECSFVAAGGKDIDDGKLGCGVSRFGCWQCYMVRDTDKSLDGLMNSGYNNVDLYKEYRDWYWNLTQQSWEKTRDPYNHRTQVRDLYNKGGEESPKFGMTMPKGLKLQIRKNSLKRLLELQDKLDEEIITLDEIILIQERWLNEGDLQLTAFTHARKHNFKILNTEKVKELRSVAINAREYYKHELLRKPFSNKFAVLTLKRFAVQYIKDPKKVEKKFFPSKEEERHIRKEWKKQTKIEVNKKYNLLITYL
ncbi:phosphoadenosine phosphosulfate reductase family protein [Sulfurimonas sp.]|uniref:phosphoadenosine phosphosulfate reductase domain-containing protein n=1 Tax=Sulfurimonas sp. TaxID=2022749 RepID=UPI00356887FD